MRTILIAFAALLLGLGTAAVAQQHGHESSAQATHHACLDQERQAIERGEGFGMALPADRNGFPGPKHILELREPLELTTAQEEQVRRLFDRMHAQALAVGRKLLEKEVELEQLFTSGTVGPAAVQRLLEEGAALRAELRWVHLGTHLDAHSLLTPEQRARYQALRHGLQQRQH